MRSSNRGSVRDRTAEPFGPGSTASPALAYEERLSADPDWALSEGSRFLDGHGTVHEAARQIARRLEDLGVPYAVADGLALVRHGYRRFTEDVDILVTPDGLRTIHERLVGLGYARVFAGSRNLRDAVLGVKVEFLLTGSYPGDGKPKPVAFPNPADVAIESEGIRCINLPTLIELKLASGMTNVQRMKDLTDVQEVIQALQLPLDFADRLNTFVQDAYRRLWKQARRRYVRLWRNKWITSGAQSVAEMIAALRAAAAELEAMLSDGVVLDCDSGIADDYAHLVTFDPEIAKKYGMHDETEIWDERAGEEPPSDEG